MRHIAMFLTLFALTAVSCYQDAEQIDVIAVGVDANEYVVPRERNRVVVPVLANTEFTVSFAAETDWAHFTDYADRSSVRLKGYSEIAVTCTDNLGLARYLDLVVACGNRRETIRIKQPGLYNDDLTCPDRNWLVGWKKDVHLVKVLTLLPRKEIGIDVEYDTEDGEWLSELAFRNNYLSFTVDDNDSSTERSAVVRLSATNGWDEPCTGRIRITQQSQQSSPQEISFAGLRDLLPQNGSTAIAEDLVLKGHVIGDNTEGNGAQTLNLTISRLDTEAAARTSFVQSPDGNYGIKLVFDSAEANPLKRYDLVTLSLRGTTLVREGGEAGADEPVRYTLRDVSERHVLESTAGTAGTIVRKVKSIGELTDRDLYTFVTLPECEIPIRKGPFAPICQFFDNFMGIYPMVVRDRVGSTMYLVNNVSCAYARNGERMPYGSGSISGVVVHEKCDQFEWNTALYNRLTAEGYLTNQIRDIGNIGRYQIRPMSRSDIDLAAEFEAGFSEMICEFRYFNAANDAIVRNVDENNHLWATYSAYAVGEGAQSPAPVGTANGEMWHTDSAHAITTRVDWTYLGPVDADGRFTSLGNGNGVDDANGNPAHFSLTGTLTTNGSVDIPNGSAWKHNYWYLSGDYQSWVVRFSTERIDRSHRPMSVQLGALGCSSLSFGAPRYWNVEYSTDGATWHYVAEYTVPDNVMATNRKFWQTAAFKYMSFTLPDDADVWGKERVYIRLIPARNVAGSQYAYEVPNIVSNRESCLNYFAVRCNK